MRKKICFALLVSLVLFGVSKKTFAGILASSTFDTDLDGWIPTVPAETNWESNGGNPGGYIRFVDVRSSSGQALAPQKFLGDWSAMGVGAISFDHKLFSSGPEIYDYEINISGSGGTARWTSPAPNGVTAWETLEAPLEESEWEVTGSWSALLVSVTELRIRIETATGHADTEGIDNVELITTSLGSCADDYFEQPTYSGPCLSRPPGSVCVAYSDGYIWLINDAIQGSRPESCDLNQISVAIGFRGEYYHIKGTDYVKFVAFYTCDPSIDIILNQDSLTTGDTLTATARITNDDTPDNVEVKIWIEVPDGETMKRHNIPSYNVPANTDLTAPVFNHTFDGGEQAGTYQFGARFLDIITGEHLCEDIEPFTFNPAP